ncbi:Chorion peroxidase [Chionoecetes opilio]|uniref:Chorion peroxidase n=1 Tax=Chionoecetes opilio TaxID=41210 RepID=A0A8J5CFZ0_CHIOP|nr:Chorion peroxidase [Chionoecetes opilio]
MVRALICCSRHGGEELHPRCAPMDVSGDPFYAQFGKSCMNFVRSMLAIGPGKACTFGFAEQLNHLTHWIDGSTVYGNNEDEAKALRSFQNGLLRTSRGNMLPINPNQGGECEAELRNAECFLAGESRVNEQPGLTTVHTLMLREHNRIAKALQRIRPQWGDGAFLFQEARRFCDCSDRAHHLHEWLPIIIAEVPSDWLDNREGRAGTPWGVWREHYSPRHYASVTN